MMIRFARLLLAIALSLVACENHPDSRAQQHTVGLLVRELRYAGPFPRRWSAELSIPIDDAVCPERDSVAFALLVCPSATESRFSDKALAAAVQIGNALKTSMSADAAHAAGLLELISEDSSRKTMDRSISYLEMATKLAQPTAAVFSDLAAAHLIRAARWHDTRELLASLEASSHALEIDSTYAAAWHNRALALNELSLDSQVSQAMQHLHRTDSARAKRLGPRLANHGRPERDFIPGDPNDALLAVQVRRQPVTAINTVWEDVLGRWGDAVLTNRHGDAEAQLQLAGVIGETLAAMGDSLTAVAVKSIRATRQRSPNHVLLARAHSALASAQQLRRRNSYREADSLFDALLRMEHSSPALRLRIAADAANNAVSRGRPVDAMMMLRELLQAVPAQKFPAVVGRALWTSGLIDFRRGRPATALKALRTSRALFERIQFDEYAAWVLGIEGELLTQTGSDVVGQAALVNALRRSRTMPRSIGRHNSLFVLAGVASAAGLPRAAMAIEDEDSDANGAAGSPITIAELRLARARLLQNHGRQKEAIDAVERTEVAIANIPDSLVRVRLHHELGTLRGRQLLTTDAFAARRILDSTVAVLHPIGNTIKTLPALIARAHVAVALGDDAAAESDLTKLATIYLDKVRYVGDSVDGRRQRLGLLTQRQALLQQARPVFDSLVLRRLRRGGVTADSESLALFEQWKNALASNGSAIGAHPAPIATQMPTVAYASLGNELIIWTNVSGVVRSHRVQVQRDTLTVLVDRARVALEQSSVDVARTLLEQLFDLLIRPIDGGLGQNGTEVRFVLDDALANTPMAALRDSKRKQFLIEQISPRVARHWNANRPTRAGRAASFDGVLVIEAPAYVRAAFPALAALPNARLESNAIVSRFDAAKVLRGAAADSTQVRRAMSNVELFHFAGHAVLDDARPDRSALVLGANGLSANDIAQLDLHRLRVAVLSACETSRSAGSGGRGFGELTAAFLLAGTEGVVGSLWRAEDAATAQLMVAFYKRLSATQSVAVALREAQLSMISRPISEWAAFRFVGQ